LGLKVLSLFDGMSCGQLALQRLGIEVDTYYASEIDKYAIQVTQANFPKTIQVGDVCELKAEDYQDIDLILAGSPCQGFSFAGKQLAFDDPRSALFFEFVRLLKEIKPKYFLLENVRMKQQFQDVITEQVSACYPDFEGGDLFGSQIKPILINSALLSAQNRQRLYWTNIPNVEQPVDKGIVLKDILEDDVEDHYLAGEYLQNNYQGGNQLNPNYKSQANTIHDTNKKSGVICAGTHGYANGYVETKPKQVGLAIEKVKVRKHEVDIPKLQECILDHFAKCKKTKKEIAKDLNDSYSTVEHYFRKIGSDFFSIPSEEHWPKLKEILDITTNEFDKSIMEFEIRDGVYESTQRVYSQEGKSPTLTSAHAEKLVETKPKVAIKNLPKGSSGKSWFFEQQTYLPDSEKTRALKSGSGSGNIPKVVSSAWRGRYKEDGTTEQKLELNQSGKSNSLTTVQKDSVVVNEELSWRKLTPLECERLQTVPDNYTNHVSNTQRYKMLGNGWTVEVIAHILNNMEL
jgi:DNA-cytosine methyltransferase